MGTGFPDIFYDLITPETGASIKLEVYQRMELRCLSRFQGNYITKTRGSGKCISGDSLILTSDGIKEIGSLFSFQCDNKETIYEQDVEIVNRYGNIEKSYKGIYSGKKPTKKIKTRLGYSIECTHNHPLLVMNDNGELEYKESKDLKIGDFLCLRRGDNVWGSNTEIKNYNEINEWLNSRDENHNRLLKIRDMPNFINEDIAYLLGILVGDGSVNSKNTIGFSNIDTDIIENFYRILNSLGVYHIGHPNKNDYTFTDMYFRKYLEILGLKYCTAHTKCIPDIILSSPRNIVKRFIQGLYDTDGCAESNIVTYSSVSYKLIFQLKTILLNFGIVTSTRVKIDKNGFKSYILVIVSSCVDIFNREIGFSCNRKRIKAEKLSFKNHNTNIDIIPNQKELLKPVYKLLDKYSKRYFYNCVKGNNQMTYYKIYQLMNIINYDVENFEHFEELSSLNYFYDRIEDIIDSENDVYDLETTETHSFVANGIVNHNTLVSMMNAFHTCIFYPNIQIGLTAQTRENSAKLIKDKYDEFIRAFPLLKEEIYSAKFSKDVAEVEFHNGSRLTNLANQQSSKGAHLQRGLVDEDNLTDEETYLDVLEPIFTTVPRLTVGKKCVVDPYERNFSISQTTSSGFRGSSAYYRCLKKYHNMLNLKGEMCLGASWKMGVFYGRGASKSDILKKKETNSSVSFDMNYNAVWTGAADDALVSMAKFLACRTLGTAEIKGDEQHIYGLGVDIARSDNTGNNQTSISVLKVVKRPTGRIKEVQVVNIIPISGTMDFEAQAIEIKRIDKFFNTEFIVVDENGMGRGISDFLVKEQIDPLTGESLGCLDTMNSDRIPEIPNSPKKIFCYLAQKYDNESIMTFIDYVETKKLRLLEKKDTTSYASMQKNSNNELDRLPFLQTDFLFEEVSNLKLKKLNNGGLSIDRISKKVNKDRFSSVQYGLWYAVKNYDFAETNNSDDLGELAKYIMW